MSVFDSLELLPEDPILGIPKMFAADPRPNKVNLGIGTYKDAEGASYVLDCVRDAEAALLTRKMNKEYLAIEGDMQLAKLIGLLIFGTQEWESNERRLFTAQTIGGTGALYIGGKLLLQQHDAIYIPNATWPNHHPLFTRLGMQVHTYPYYDDHKHQIDFDKMCHEIALIPPGNAILLHPCCHNPTGIDPTQEQWKHLSALIKKQRLIPFFDFAYQGFRGTIDDDAFAIRYFASQGHEMLVAYSCAKNFGLYGERVGTLSIVTQDQGSIQKVASQVKKIIRSHYSSPPRHGADIVSLILNDEAMKKTWIHELGNMRDRLQEMRHTLIAGLQARNSFHDWTFLNRQRGFFSFCGLNERQVQRMIKDYAIYMPVDGRINVGGLNGHNMEYVIGAITDVVSS